MHSGHEVMMMGKKACESSTLRVLCKQKKNPA